MTRATDGPIRPLTPRQQTIADGIRRGLSYKQIGKELRIGAGTVRRYVYQMALLFDNREGLAPRDRIWLWVKHREWEAAHAAARSA